MPRKKRFDYREKARQLRAYGFKTKYGTHRKGAGSPQAKAAVKRQWEKIRVYTPGGSKQDFVFREATAEQKKVFRGTLSKKQQTPGGFFFPVPKGIKRRNFRIKPKTANEVEVEGRGERGGFRREIIKAVDPEKLAIDPKKAVRDLVGKLRPSQVLITVNGFNSTAPPYSWEAFLTYAPELFAQLMDPNRKAHPVYKGTGKGGRIAHSRTRGNGHPEPMEPEEIADIFHVKLIYQQKSRSPNAKGKRKLRNRRH